MSMKVCPKCNITHQKSGKFCSPSCANSRGPRTEEFKNAVRAKLAGVPTGKKGITLVDRIEKQCLHCNGIFLTTEKELNYRKNMTCGNKECIKAACREAGKRSASNRKTRSADEVKLYEYCVSEFPKSESNLIIADGWDADIVIPDHKIAILWNGPWHYKDMKMKNHSLAQVQTRDKIKTKLFESLGWTVIVYEDRYYTPETAFQDLIKRVGSPAWTRTRI